MPKYDYECVKCGKVVSVRHSVSETPDLDSDCKSDKCDMEKKPTSFRILTEDRQKSDSKPGQLVKSHIEQAREELKGQKKDLSKDYDV